LSPAYAPFDPGNGYKFMSQAKSRPAGQGGGPEWVTVDGERAGQRIDNFVMAHLKGVPRGRVYRMLRKGEVRINGRRCRPADRLQAGDQVRLPPAATRQGPGPVPDKVRAQMAAAILYEDAAMAVLDKPAGLAVHSGSGTPFGVIEALAAARPEAEWGLAHRLDRGTSGCLVVGKGAGATRALQAAFRDERVTKAYLALLVGEWPEAERLVEVPLRRGPERDGQRPMVADPEQGQAAATRFLTLRLLAGYTLVRAEPRTGRTHQIRAHARAMGYPLAGDPLYGEAEANGALKSLGLDRMFLHSAEINVPHPISGEGIAVKAALPAELKGVLERL
jgi:23S rRNA pseudouridine955/2504/2580 synthase